MPPAGVAAIAEGLRVRLATITGLRTSAFQPDSLTPPVAFPVLESVEYHRAFGGGDVRYRWSVVVIVGRYVDRATYGRLDGYLSFAGGQSVRAAIEGDTTLGGAARALIVDTSAAISALSVAEAEYMQLQFTVLVHG